VFAVFIGISGHALISSQEMGIVSGDRIRASTLSRLAVDAVRSIRDESYDDLQEGTFGVRIGDDGKWEFNGTEMVSEDGFTTSVVVSFPDDDHADVTTTTTWSFGSRRNGTTSVTTQLSNWHQVKEIGDWEYPSLAGSYIPDTPPNFNDIAISGVYVFVTSETAGGGAGLYVVKTTDLASPERKAIGFTLGADGYQLLISNNKLYVLTAMPGAELHVYDVSSPDTFSAANLLGTFDLQGSGRGRSLAIFGNTLFVGATDDVTPLEDEFFALDVEDPSSIQLIDSLDGDGTFYDLSLLNGYAYVGSSEDVAELVVIDVFDVQDLQFASGRGYNLTDSLDGLAVTTFGDSALLGRAVGDVIQELVLFNVDSNPVPTPPPLPWYHGVGANVNALDSDPTGTYAFGATEHEFAEMQVFDPALLELRIASYDTDTGIGRGIKYDIQRDRLFVTTTTALLIFAPSP